MRSEIYDKKATHIGEILNFLLPVKIILFFIERNFYKIVKKNVDQFIKSEDLIFKNHAIILLKILFKFQKISPSSAPSLLKNYSLNYLVNIFPSLFHVHYYYDDVLQEWICEMCFKNYLLSLSVQFPSWILTILILLEREREIEKDWVSEDEEVEKIVTRRRRQQRVLFIYLCWQCRESIITLL